MWGLISRVLSAAVAIGYLVVAAIGGGPAAAVAVAVFLLLPLACIWFSEAMSSVAYIKGLPMNETPGCFVAAGGWLLLLFPIVATVFGYFQQRGQ